MIRTAAPGLLAVLLVSSTAPALANEPSSASQTACLKADAYKARRAGREQIVTDCAQALSQAPADRGVRVRLLVQRSQALWRLNRSAEAEADAEAALALASDDVDAILARGVARLDQDRVDEALADFNAVLKVQPTNKIALLYRGRVWQWRKGDPAAARADYDAALKTDPDFVRALVQRADLRASEDPVAAERDLARAIALSPDDSFVRLRLGVLYEGQDRRADAMAVYDSVIKAEPDDPTALVYRSEYRRALNDAAGALRDADQAVRVDPKAAMSHTARAQALVVLSRPGEAMIAYRDALRANPADLTALIGIGAVSRKTGQLDEGLQALDAALRSSPSNIEALFTRALVWTSRQDPKRAIADYDALLAIRASAAAHYNRGQLLSGLEDHKAAAADFRKAAELDPKDPDALNALGGELAALGGQGEDELKAYEAALKLDPANTAARVNIARHYADQEDWSRAVEAYRRALVEQPRRADLQVALGDSLLNLGEEDTARKAYDQAVKLDPKAVDAWRARAKLHHRAGRLRLAIADYGRALTLEPQNIDLLVERASVLKLDDKQALAMADLDEAVRVAPRSTFALNNRGLAHADAGRSDAALADYARAIEADPDYEPVYYNRAGVFIDQDRYDRAIRDLNVSLRLAPGDGMSLARKGYVYYLLKDYRRALEELDAAVSADPDYAQALNWRARVKEALNDEAGAKADRAKAQVGG